MQVAGHNPGRKEKFVLYYIPHTFYRSIFDYYMESTYFDYDWENFFMDDIGLCEKNDRRRTKYDFMSEVCVAFMEKGINKRNAHHILSLKMSDEQIEKYFNTNYDTRHLFRIMVAHLMDLDSEQITQIEDKSHEPCSQALLVQFISGVSADKTAPILKMPVSQEDKLSQIGKLSGDEIYTLVSHSYFNGRRKTVHIKARRTPEDNFIDDDGNIYKNLLEFPLYTQFEY